MTKEQFTDAVNRLAAKCGWVGWEPISTKNLLFVSVLLPNLVAVLWYKQIDEDADTRLIREQLHNLWGSHGGLKFD